MLDKITNAQYQKKVFSNVMLCYEQNVCLPPNSQVETLLSSMWWYEKVGFLGGN